MDNSKESSIDDSIKLARSNRYVCSNYLRNISCVRKKMTDYKQLILDRINGSTGVKAVDLVVSIMSKEVNPQVFKLEEYDNALRELVDSGQIIEMEYVLPHMDYRTKSIYFPKRTTFTFRQGKK